MLGQRRQLLDQSSSPVRPMYESLDTALLDSVAVFCFASGSARRFQVVLARSRTKAARMLRFSVVIMLLFRLETHSCLNKQGVSIGLAVRLVPLIRGFHYSAGA